MSKLSRGTDGGGVIYTAPTIETKVNRGVIQYRFKHPALGGKLSLSEAPPDGSVDKKGHYHKGLFEVYTVHEGWLEVAFQVNQFETAVIEPGPYCVFIAMTGVPHAILQGPGSLFVVQTVGKPVPNKDRKNNDWYPAHDEFNEKAREYFRSKGYDV